MSSSRKTRARKRTRKSSWSWSRRSWSRSRRTRSWRTDVLPMCYSHHSTKKVARAQN